MTVLDTQVNFRALSLKDLVDAREQYHLHLLNKANVVGTAVGLYLIRKTDKWPTDDKPVETRSRGNKPPRTLESSEVRPYSWPCVLVFVDQWVEASDFKGKYNPYDMVPKTLYLSDGRAVPVCTVLAEPRPANHTAQPVGHWPKSYLGGGYPLYTTAQEVTRRASAGGLVTDGRSLFCLTSRHALGEKGSAVNALVRGKEEPVGVSSGISLTRLPFNEVYPYLPHCNGFSALDVGLVYVDDATRWTSRTYGLAAPKALADINEMNLGTQLIDQKVCAYGAASRRMDGKIKALFYRFKSVAGFDYVGDLLLAPEPGSPFSHPGDSGTVWHLVVERSKGKEELYPLATQWGGLGLGLSSGTHNFGIATLLSNVLRLLDLEYVIANNASVRPFWGATGHYSIARMAIDVLGNGKLKTLMTANATNISFDESELVDGDIGEKLNAQKFVPLADVPDIVWKKNPNAKTNPVKGGRDIGFSKPEHPTHYADIDQDGPNGSLVKLCKASAANVSVQVWQDYYDSLGQTQVASRGLLPFRVWQFYDYMIAALSGATPDISKFVAAGGIMAHYTGDSCQPLHGSRFSNGFQDQAHEETTSTGKTKKVWPAQGVHSAYEDVMIDGHTKDLFDKIKVKLASPSIPIGPINSGHDAAVATVAVMIEAQRLMKPETICNRYIALGGGKSKAVSDGLWTTFGDATAQSMVNGIVLLARIWEGAWRNGNGTAVAAGQLGAIPTAALEKLYREDPKFVPSLDLDHIGPILR